MPFPPVAEQIALLTRGVVDLHVRAELEERLEASRQSGKPLRVKAGFDPTRPDLHIGHAVLLSKMRQFQELGHTAILLVGEFTAMVGDPTGQNDLRPRLTREAVREAAKENVTVMALGIDPRAKGTLSAMFRQKRALGLSQPKDVAEAMTEALCHNLT